MNGPEPLFYQSSRSEVEKSSLRISEALQAFRNDLAQLIGEAPGQWVAYDGGERIGIGPTKAAIYQLCLGKGLPRGDFLVRSIEPELDEVIVGPGIPLGAAEDRGA